MFDELFINGILILFPYFVYIFYITTNRKLKTSNKDIVLFITTMISILLLFRYGINKKTIMLLLNIPLYISLINKKYLNYVFVLIAIIISYNTTLLNMIILIINYLFLIVINIYLKNKNGYFLIFIILNSFIYALIFGFINALMPIISFIILIFIFNIMYKMGNDIIGFNKELNDLEKEKEVRISLFKITHEIKNPIAVCKAYLDMYDVNDKKKSQKYIKIMKGEIERILGLLEDFMLVNKDNINCDIMDINYLLEEKVKNINELMNIRKINIKYDINDEEIYVFGDYNRLSQVFINLIKNSIEADSNNIVLKSYIENNYVIVNITDDGMGIDSNTMQRIKEPFYTTKVKGTGLGVSLSEEIIKAHNGILKYESEYGRGTSVKVMIPLYEI